MSKKRNRGNGSGSVFKRRDDGPYVLSWYDQNGTRREHNTLQFDKQTAERILADKLSEVALRRDGIIDAKLESISIQSKRSITEHLDDFKAMLTALQRSESHVTRTKVFITEVCTKAGFVSASDISADGLNKVVAEMQAEDKAARTIQGRVVAMKAFTKWLTDHDKLAHDPLRSVKRPSTKTDRRRRRRMLLPTEWPYLKAATLKSGPRNGISPIERITLYETAIQTGLRSAELRSLKKVDLFLAGDKPYIRCRAENTKNGNVAKQYIEKNLAEDLRRLTANKTPGASVFVMPDPLYVARTLREDLDAARKAWLAEAKHDDETRKKREESDFLAVTNEQGESLDFHSLRHTTGAWLALKGVHVGVIKTVMRHSSITLTMDTYGHLLPDQHSEAIGVMASMLNDQNPLAATGTAGIAPAVQTAVEVRKQTPSDATKCDETTSECCEDASDAKRNLLRIADVCDGKQSDAMKAEIGPDRIRTCNQGIMSPLLCR